MFDYKKNVRLRCERNTNDCMDMTTTYEYRTFRRQKRTPHFGLFENIAVVCVIGIAHGRYTVAFNTGMRANCGFPCGASAIPYPHSIADVLTCP